MNRLDQQANGQEKARDKTERACSTASSRLPAEALTRDPASLSPAHE